MVLVVVWNIYVEERSGLPDVKSRMQMGARDKKCSFYVLLIDTFKSYSGNISRNHDCSDSSTETTWPKKHCTKQDGWVTHHGCKLVVRKILQYSPLPLAKIYVKSRHIIHSSHEVYISSF